MMLPACLLLAACGSSPAATGFPPGGGAPSAGPGCVDTSAASDIWKSVNNRLNQIALDPRHQGLADVATGTALLQLQQYIQSTLIAKNLTEREVDTLDSLTVTDAGCNGGPLQVTVSTTVKQDDYLKPDGGVDHSDPVVGGQLHLAESFDRVKGVWKVSRVSSLDAPSPSAQVA
jgi:hypothetical protein